LQTQAEGIQLNFKISPRGAPALPLNSQDLGTSRWQLAIERYTNFPRGQKRCVMAAMGFGPGPLLVEQERLDRVGSD
jgi:hypothetical protein